MRITMRMTDDRRRSRLLGSRQMGSTKIYETEIPSQARDRESSMDGGKDSRSRSFAVSVVGLKQIGSGARGDADHGVVSSVRLFLTYPIFWNSVQELQLLLTLLSNFTLKKSLGKTGQISSLLLYWERPLDPFEESRLADVAKNLRRKSASMIDVGARWPQEASQRHMTRRGDIRTASPCCWKLEARCSPVHDLLSQVVCSAIADSAVFLALKCC